MRHYIISLSLSLSLLIAAACGDSADVSAPSGEAESVSESARDVSDLSPAYDGPYCEPFCWWSPDAVPGEGGAQCANKQCCKVFCWRAGEPAPVLPQGAERARKLDP